MECGPSLPARNSHLSRSCRAFHIVVTLPHEGPLGPLLANKAFHVCHRSRLFVMLNKNTVKTSTITASIGRMPESKENIKYKKSSASTHAQSAANFPSMARLRSKWAPLTCAMLRPSDETLPVSCSSPCGISCVEEETDLFRERPLTPCADRLADGRMSPSRQREQPVLLPHGP